MMKKSKADNILAFFGRQMERSFKLLFTKKHLKILLILSTTMAGSSLMFIFQIQSRSSIMILFIISSALAFTSQMGGHSSRRLLPKARGAFIVPSTKHNCPLSSPSKLRLFHRFPFPHAGDEEILMKSTEVKIDNMDSMMKTCRSFIAATVTAGALFFLPPTQNNMISDLAPASQFRVDQSTTSFEKLFQIQPAFAEDDVLVLQNSEETDVVIIDDAQLAQRTTVLDEVWSLVDKYYLDRSFHGQDWNSLRNDYEARLPVDPTDKSYDDETAMKLATTMVQSLGDKYSRILDKPSYSRIQKFDLIGVGATLMPNSEKRIMVGAPPVDGSEADKNGIKYGDFITAVNGVPTKGRTAFEIIDQISEDPNAKTVTMTVLTEGPDNISGEGYARDIVMNRAFNEIKNPVSFKISEKRSDGTTVGYIRISEFNSLVKSKLEEALVSLEKEGANAYVLDVRSNPGGAFQSAVEIAGLFMDDKIATSVVDSNQVEMPFRTTKDKVVVNNDHPLVIWLDGGSASATEVLAGALHDQCRAVVMGSNSFGKGLIQAVYGLRNGCGLVLTVARYVTPNGTDIQGSGITPDIDAKLPFLLVPGLSSDTSKVDFKDAAARLQPSICLSTEM